MESTAAGGVRPLQCVCVCVPGHRSAARVLMRMLEARGIYANITRNNIKNNNSGLLCLNYNTLVSIVTKKHYQCSLSFFICFVKKLVTSFLWVVILLF